jgi:hypothetical protein
MAEAKPKLSSKKAINSNKRQVSIGRAQDYALMYADGVRISISGYDIKLTFTVTETLATGNVMITEMATIAISPQHAKELAVVLTRNVAQYEKDIMPLEMKEYPPKIES